MFTHSPTVGLTSNVCFSSSISFSTVGMEQLQVHGLSYCPVRQQGRTAGQLLIISAHINHLVGSGGISFRGLLLLPDWPFLLPVQVEWTYWVSRTPYGSAQLHIRPVHLDLSWSSFIHVALLVKVFFQGSFLKDGGSFALRWPSGSYSASNCTPPSFLWTLLSFLLGSLSRLSGGILSPALDTLSAWIPSLHCRWLLCWDTLLLQASLLLLSPNWFKSDPVNNITASPVVCF